MEDADYLEREEEAAMRDDAVMNEDTDVADPAHSSANNVVISRGAHAAANLDISDPSVQRAIEMLRRSSQSSSGSENPDTADMMRRPMTSRMMSTSSISDILGSSNANPLVSNSMPLLGNMQLSFFPDITMSQQQGYATQQQQRTDTMALNLLDILQFPKVFRNLVSISGTKFQGVVPTLCRRARMIALNFSNASNFEMFSSENTGRSSQMGFQPVQPMQFVPVESSIMTGIVSSSAPLMPQASIVQSSAVAEEEDYKSVIECGIFHEGKRHLTFNLDYFGQEVEVFTAVSDRFKRILVRPATLAKKLDCSTSRIGMHLHRSENKFRDGIFQAIGYSEKPSFQVKRLRSGAYFVSVDSCKVIEDSFRKRPAQKTFEGSAEANQPRKKSKKSPATGPVQATSSPAEVATAAVSVGLPAQSFQGIGNPFFFPTSQNANLGAALFHPLLQLPQGNQQALLNQASIINQENNSTQAQTQQGSSSVQQQQQQQNSSSAFQGFNPQSQISQIMNGMNGSAGGQQISVGFLPLIGASNFTQVVPNQVLQNPHGLSTGAQDQHQSQNQNAGLNLLSQFVQKAKEQQDQQQQQQNAQANAVQNFQQQVTPNLFYAPHLFNQTQFPTAAAMLSMQTQLPMQAQLPFAGNDLSSWNNNGNDLSTNFLQQLMNLANGNAVATNNQSTMIGDVSGNGNASLKNSPSSPKSSE